MQIITSRNNERIKAVVRLHERKERTQTGLFFTEGIHLAEEYIRNVGMPEQVFFTENALSRYEDFFKNIPEDIKYFVSDSVFEKMSTELSPQGVICVCKMAEIKKTLPEHGSLLFLESVRDTGNLGTVIRTCLALGVKGTVLSPDCADIYNPKTIRASMGAVFGGAIYMPDDFYTALDNAKKYGKIYATALHEDSLVLGEFTVNSGDSFVVGNEGNGISDITKSKADATVIIPMTGKTESLNVACATAIIIWEMTRCNNGC